MRIYIEGMKELPKDCGKCPIHRLIYSINPASAICPIMKGRPKDIADIGERSPNCPLREQRQPNRFDAIVQILKDADFRQEDDLTEEDEYIRIIADMICQLFKDGPYDEEENMVKFTDEDVKKVEEILNESERLENENKKLKEQLDLMSSYVSDIKTADQGKGNEVKIKVKTEGVEEAEEGIRNLSDPEG